MNLSQSECKVVAGENVWQPAILNSTNTPYSISRENLRDTLEIVFFVVIMLFMFKNGDVREVVKDVATPDAQDVAAKDIEIYDLVSQCINPSQMGINLLERRLVDAPYNATAALDEYPQYIYGSQYINNYSSIEAPSSSSSECLSEFSTGTIVVFAALSLTVVSMLAVIITLWKKLKKLNNSHIANNEKEIVMNVISKSV